jgi:methionyl-tRNA formyltransferase
MGTPPFSVSILKALREAGHEILCVYSQPPRPAGRGYSVTPSAVHQYADSQKIEVRTPLSLRSEEEQEKFRSLEADVAVVVAYGLLLPKPILEAPSLGCVNVHASLLPRWRGAAPIQRAILEGDSITGITIMKMDEGLDTGPELSHFKIPINVITTSASLFQEMADKSAPLLLETLEKYKNGQIKPKLQPIEGATYASKIEKSEARLNWSETAVFLERKVRAFDPVPGTWFEWKEHRFKVLKAKAYEVFKIFPEAQWGEVLDSTLKIACSQGVFQPLELQKSGGKPMDFESFLRGFPIPEGTKLDVHATV